MQLRRGEEGGCRVSGDVGMRYVSEKKVNCEDFFFLGRPEEVAERADGMLELGRER